MQHAPEEGQRNNQLKCCGDNNKDKENSPNDVSNRILFHNFLVMN